MSSSLQVLAAILFSFVANAAPSNKPLKLVILSAERVKDDLVLQAGVENDGDSPIYVFPLEKRSLTILVQLPKDDDVVWGINGEAFLKAMPSDRLVRLEHDHTLSRRIVIPAFFHD